MIKAIETVYKGYRFRSRLEARWAVFFDTLGIKYEYEEEGFNLDGVWYLPDFFIPVWNAYVEIKPSQWQIPEDEWLPTIRKCIALSITKSRVLLLLGQPWPDDEHIIALYEDGELIGTHMHFALCRKCDTEIWLMSEHDGATVLNNNPNCHTEKWPIEDAPRLMAAYTAARQARFEHRS